MKWARREKETEAAGGSYRGSGLAVSDRSLQNLTVGNHCRSRDDSLLLQNSEKKNRVASARHRKRRVAAAAVVPLPERKGTNKRRKLRFAYSYSSGILVWAVLTSLLNMVVTMKMV
ncbi:hypothetical protein AAC387_Pa05g0595 [Persea americana]